MQSLRASAELQPVLDKCALQEQNRSTHPTQEHPSSPTIEVGQHTDQSALKERRGRMPTNNNVPDEGSGSRQEDESISDFWSDAGAARRFNDILDEGSA